MRFRLLEAKDHKKYTQEEIQRMIDKIVNDGYLSVWAMNDFRPATDEPSNSPDYSYESEDFGEYRNVDKITIDSFEVDEDEDEDFYYMTLSFTVEGAEGTDSFELTINTSDIDNLDKIITDSIDAISTSYDSGVESPFRYEI